MPFKVTWVRDSPSERLTGREHKRMDSNPSKVGKHIHLARLRGPPVGGPKQTAALRREMRGCYPAGRRPWAYPGTPPLTCAPTQLRPAVIGRSRDAQKGVAGPLAEFVSVVFLCGHDSDQGHKRASPAAAPCTPPVSPVARRSGAPKLLSARLPKPALEFNLGAGPDRVIGVAGDPAARVGARAAGSQPVTQREPADETGVGDEEPGEGGAAGDSGRVDRVAAFPAEAVAGNQGAVEQLAAPGNPPARRRQLDLAVRDAGLATRGPGWRPGAGQTYRAPGRSPGGGAVRWRPGRTRR